VKFPDNLSLDYKIVSGSVSKVRKVVSLVLAALLMVTLFPLGIFASALATSGDDVIVDPLFCRNLLTTYAKNCSVM